MISASRNGYLRSWRSPPSGTPHEQRGARPSAARRLPAVHESLTIENLPSRYPRAVRRIERRILRLNDAIGRARRELELTEGELGMHRHLADDATRDALVTGQPFERPEARDAMKDAARLEAAVRAARVDLGRLEAQRDRLLDRLREE